MIEGETENPRMTNEQLDEALAHDEARKAARVDPAAAAIENDLDRERAHEIEQVRAKERRAEAILAKLEAANLLGENLKATPNAWALVAELADLTLQCALATGMRQVSGELRVDVGWLVRLPAEMVRMGVRAPAAFDVAAESPPLKLAVGVLVKLKSGGPMMTVVGLTADYAQCAWFNGAGDSCERSTPIAALSAK